EIKIDEFNLIGSEIGARLLIIARNKKEKNVYLIMDPFTSSDPVDASFIDKNLVIKELIPDKENWVLYLRKTLEDANNIFISSANEKILRFIKLFLKPSDEDTEFIQNENIHKISENIHKTSENIYIFEKYLVRWTLQCDKERDILIAESLKPGEKNSCTINFRPSYYKEPKPFTISSICLENDNLVVRAEFCLLVWSFSAKKGIQLIYCWHIYDYDDKVIEDFQSAKYFLPAPTYDFYKHISFQQEDGKRYFVEELLDEHIDNDFFLMIYGQKLIESFIDNDRDIQLRKLCNRCFDLVFESTDLPPNTQLFRIISQSITKIAKSNPTFFANFVIRIFFLYIFDESYLQENLDTHAKIRLKHLHHYGSYSRLSKSTYLDYLDSLVNIFFHSSLLNYKYIRKIIRWYKRYQDEKQIDYENPKLPLMSPLPGFVSYPKYDSFWKELINPQLSCFIEFEDLSFYETWNGEAIINFKWDTFGRNYYYAIWAVYTVFLCSFVIVATFSDNISWHYQKFFLTTAVILGFWHLFLEIRQFIHSPSNYLSSIWNYIDLSAVISTIVTSICWLKYGSASTSAITFTTLFLELRFIVFFRTISFFGMYLAIIMNTIDKVISFLIIFGFIILAFAHSLHLLLRSAYETSDSDLNMFSQFGSAILASYYIMITGDSTPITSWVSNENIIIMLLMILFSFFIIIYLMNLFIGILGNLINEADNRQAYLAIKREILVEIELFYLLPYQKRKYNWFPETFFYQVHITKVRELIQDIKSDSWNKSTKPFISKAVLDILKDEFEKTSSKTSKETQTE
ncbi:8875_t:CDS:2, partial [Scutellospora calospora]